MSLFSIKRSMKNFGRYGDIIGVLIKYGFEDIVDQLNVDVVIKKIRSRFLKKQRSSSIHKSRPERVRLALEELGPTFIKLGQMLSTRYDLIPLDYIDELRKLQDSVNPFPDNQCVRIIEEELEKPIDTLFSFFEKEPIAAASIAQVHRVCSVNGEEMVVKVQRPDIEKKIESDLPILKELAELIERHIPDSRVFDPVGLVNQFKKWINEELNFIQEARNMHRFHKNFSDDAGIYVPEVHWNLTTERVLTMEYVDGIYIDQIEAIKQAGMDPPAIAKNGTFFILRQIFEYQFFHGDPHPSNLLILPGHVIAPLDYGLMGRMDRVLVNDVSYLMLGIVKNDTNMIVRTLIHLNRQRIDVDRDQLRIDVADLLARYHAVPLHMLKFQNFFNDLVQLIRDNHIQFPQSLYLMGKSLMVMEGIAQKLDPAFDIISIAKSYFSQSMIGKTEAQKLIRDVTTMTEDYAELLTNAPRLINQILKKSRWGKIGINLHHLRIDDMLDEIDLSANRLSFSMIIAALVVGSSLIMQLDKGPRLWGLPMLGVVGFLIAGFLGLWLVFSIIRSGKI